MQREALKAVLFDAGDTLFRVRGSVGGVYSTVAARHGVTIVAAEVEQRFGAAFHRMPALAFPGAPAAELPQREYAWWKEVVAAVFSGVRFADFDAFFADLFAHFAEPETWELFPDSGPALAALRGRGLRLAIVSNFDGRLPRICEGLGIAHHFDTIIMSSRVGAAKPDPRIFATALARLGVGAAHAVHVGDSEKEDRDGAQAGGLRAILIQRDAPTGSCSDRVRDLRELTERL
jgi:putative hydrolase of the HAD superfamily